MSAENLAGNDTPVVLSADRLFDGVDFVEPPLVQLEGGRVLAVGGDVDTTGPIEHIEGSSLMPGIVDCHQHLVFDGDGTLHEQVADQTDEQLVERAWHAARRALLGGVTTIRDLGDRDFVTLPLRGDPALPTLLCAGPPITPVQGHCWYLGGECADRDAIISAVRERAERGCDVVKVMATGGFGTPTNPPWQSQFTSDDLEAIVAEAGRLGLPVAAHCHGDVGIRHAIDAGVDTIEHCTFMNADFLPDPDEQLLVDLARSGIALSATFGTCPDAPPPPPLFEQIVPRVRDAQTRVRELGGTIVIGSDAGINPGKPHDVAPRAVHQCVEIGMTAVEALRALTSGGADALGLSTKGRLVAGADADVVAVAGDLQADLEAVERVERVWRAGAPVR